MDNDLKILYSAKSRGDIDAGSCARINIALSKINIEEIPKDQIENVRDYLTISLNMKSVEIELVSKLDQLLDLLQKKDSQQK